MYKATDRVTGEVVAVKVMDRTRVKAASIEREWTVLEHLGVNPYVVQFKGSYLTPTEVTFVMEMYGPVGGWAAVVGSAGASLADLPVRLRSCAWGGWAVSICALVHGCCIIRVPTSWFAVSVSATCEYFIGASMYGGELFDRLIRRGAYTEDEARQPFRQVAEGLVYLHECVRWPGGAVTASRVCLAHVMVYLA